MQVAQQVEMFLPKLTFVRGMARRVKTLREIKLQSTSKPILKKLKVLKGIEVQPMLKKPLNRSLVDMMPVVQRKDSISSGEKEIVIKPKHSNQPVHHANTSRTFESLKLRADVITGLETLKIGHPTVIQLLGIPMVHEGNNVFCAAQTGSGKTFVYALPIINMIRDDIDNGFVGRLSRPKAVVVAPARELAIQILKVFKSFSHSAPFRSLGLIGQKQKKWTREYIKGLVDVVVATPDILLKYHRKGLIIFSDLRYIVLDEADTLLDENFKETTQEILSLCRFESSSIIPSTKKPVQCILTAATLPPKGILSGYKSVVPDLKVCQSNLHKVLPNVKHTFTKTEQSKKIELLLNKLQHFPQESAQKCIVFCNTSKACNWLALQLNEKNIKHSRVNGDMNPKDRFKNFESFISGENRLLLCTDIASRGIDITDVTLIVNFDCPFTTSDYIHRSGRTGRATEVFSGKGEVLTYITQNKEVLFAHKVQTAAERNESLDDIHSKRNPLKTKYKKEMQTYDDLMRKEKQLIKARNKERQSTRKLKERYALKKIKESSAFKKVQKENPNVKRMNARLAKSRKKKKKLKSRK